MHYLDTTCVQMSNKSEIISRVYNDLNGRGSMNESTKGAKKIGQSVKQIRDVKERFDNKVKKQKQSKGH